MAKPTLTQIQKDAIAAVAPETVAAAVKRQPAIARQPALTPGK